jgi:Mce-associated membrane protein
MVSPRERPRPTRRRIAGERTRPTTGGPAATPPPRAGQAQAPVEERPVEERPVETPDSPATGDTRAEPLTPDTVDAPGSGDARTVPAADEHEAAGAPRAVEQPTGEPGAKPEGAAAGRPRPRLTLPWLGDDDTPGPPNWVLAVLTGLLVAALALDGFVVWREVSHRQAEEDAARAMHSAVVQAPSVAERAAQALLSYRYDRLPQEVAEARRYVTDDYAPNYVNTIRRLVAGSAKDLKVTVQAKVLASGVSEAGPHRADVLLFVDQTTTSAAEAPKTALNRVVFTMVPRDGGWKVDEIQAF